MSYAYRVMQKIRVAYATFVRETGREPNAIYLGSEEIKWLEGLPGLQRWAGDNKDMPDMIAGMLLFEVKKPSHIAVGFMVHGKD